MKKVEKPTINKGNEINDNYISKHNIPIVGYGIDFKKLCSKLGITTNSTPDNNLTWEAWFDYTCHEFDKLPKLHDKICVFSGVNSNKEFIYVPAELPILYDDETEPEKQFTFGEIMDGLIFAVQTILPYVGSNKNPKDIEDQIKEYIYREAGMIATCDYC